MKNIFLFAFITAIIISGCSAPAPDNTYTIMVTAEDADGKQLMLQNRVDGEWIAIDSIVMTEGQAVFAGTINNPEIYFLSIEGSKGTFGFFVEASTINLQLNTENLRDSDVTGSATHDRYTSYLTNYEAFNDRIRAIYGEYQAAEQIQDEEAMALAESAFDDVQDEQAQYLVDFVNNNGDDVVAHYALFRNSYMFELEELEGMVSNFNPEVNTAYADELRDKITILKRVDIGQPFVDFEQEDPNGEFIALAEAVGSKLLLVDFWASWCAPCRKENPNIVAVYQDYKNKGFDVFGVSLDTDKDKWIEAIEVDQLDWWQVSDLAGWGNAAGKLYGVQSIPHSVLLDENGIIIAKNLRDEELREQISSLLD